MYKYFTELVDFVGSRPKPFDNTKKYISTGALKTNNISEDDIEMIDFATRPSRADLEVKNGDILFAKMAYTDKRLLVNDVEASHIYSTGFFAVKPKDGILTAKCLYYLLSSETFKNQKDANSTGATQKAITIEGLKKIKLRVPEYNKQDRIGSVLENIERIIKYKQQQLSEYDQLIKSRFVEMFESFKKTDLSNIAEIIMGQSPDSAYYNENGVGLPFFQGKADFGSKYTNVSYWTTKPSKTAKKGNVLMSVRAPVGPVNISSVDCCIGRGLCSINAIPNKTNNEFLYNALIAIQDQITAMGTGSTFKAINKSDVYAIQLPLAPISLQNEFANFVEQVDKLKFVVQKSLDETQKLFDSLMQEYFG